VKIHSLDILHLSVAFKVPYRLSKVYGTLTHNHAIVVRLRTKGGLIGWGEANPLPPFTEESPEGVMTALGEVLGPALLGRDIGDLAGSGAFLDELLPGNPLAKGAIDMALHDLAGKSQGVPVHRLLGNTAKTAIPVLWPMGSGSVDEDMALVEAKRAEGYRTFMVKMGAQAVETDIERVRALCARFDPDVIFIADANEGWDEDEALRFVTGVNDCPLALIEQPVPRRDHGALKRIREAAVAPVSADESVFSIEEAERLADQGIVDVFSIKVSKNGGIAKGQRIAGIAEAHGMRVLMNSMLECGISQAASLQLGASLGNLLPCGHAYMSTLRLTVDFTDFSALIDQGVAQVPTGPGLGIEVDWDRVRALADDHQRIGPAHVLSGSAA
jgi:muconate cycloisomerase